VDALLTKEFDKNEFDFKYIDVSSPEVLEYIEEVNTIVENDLPLPYVSLNGKPVCWGIVNSKEVFDKINKKVHEILSK
jgi:disulfide oxidoreductase YuzD